MAKLADRQQVINNTIELFMLECTKNKGSASTLAFTRGVVCLCTYPFLHVNFLCHAWLVSISYYLSYQMRSIMMDMSFFSFSYRCSNCLILLKSSFLERKQNCAYHPLHSRRLVKYATWWWGLKGQLLKSGELPAYHCISQIKIQQLNL